MTWHRHFSPRLLIYIGLGVTLLVLAFVGLQIYLMSFEPQQTTHQLENETKAETVITEKPPNKSEELVKNPSQTVFLPLPDISPPFMFGVGTELDSAINHRITKEAPVKMLTSWYNGPNDLNFMNGWKSSLVPNSYNSGYALHLIIYSNDVEQTVDTPYGSACGRPYPLSPKFLSDVTQLANIFSGDKLYVSMFTEFQTYPCDDNNWTNADKYYKTLQSQYLAAMNIFHQYSPGSQVSLSWGGWQTEWDDPGKGGGRSLFKHFADVMNASDFQSFQAMSNSNNLAIITEMTKALHPYSGGVMVSHYKPDNGSQSTFDSDMLNIFSPSSMTTLQQNGLFAFSFMDISNIDSTETSYQTVKGIVQTYAR